MTGGSRSPGGSRRPRRGQSGRRGGPAGGRGPERRSAERSPGGARDQGRRQSRGLGGEQVEGRRAVRELLAAGRRRARDVWLAEGMDDSPLLAEIRLLATERGVPVRTVGRSRLDAESHTEVPQGVLAHAEALSEADLDALCRPSPSGPSPFLVVLDGVTDPHNLGALLRTAEGAGATGAVLGRHGAVHVTATVAKAAAGAIERLPIAVVPSVAGGLADLARHGVWTVGLDSRADTSLFGLALADQPLALVMGSEGRGLARLTRQRCDLVVAIPRVGTLASLNVAAAGAVACFEVARQRLALSY
ncbi:MAG: 23S rRNA (guanosine(2251)-2'-O)-methyltransferase RlmB [Actinobacteria bacterium]|nr:MAG: 23S rRNA (guanosine(2251)-2'-O)-methyltransferase RlmB [Actinomycetota bacterium]